MRDKHPALRPDDEMLAEVELCTTLMIASSGSEAVLSQDEVDQLLGVHPHLCASAP